MVMSKMSVDKYTQQQQQQQKNLQRCQQRDSSVSVAKQFCENCFQIVFEMRVIKLKRAAKWRGSWSVVMIIRELRVMVDKDVAFVPNVDLAEDVSERESILHCAPSRLSARGLVFFRHLSTLSRNLLALTVLSRLMDARSISSLL